MNSLIRTSVAGLVVAVGLAACGAEAGTDPNPNDTPNPGLTGAQNAGPTDAPNRNLTDADNGGSAGAGAEPGAADPAQVPDPAGTPGGDASRANSDGEDAEQPPAVAEPVAVDDGQQDDPVLQVGGPQPAYLQPVHDGWEVMLVADWTIEAGVEGYYCARLTLDEDVYFNATVPLNPPGTHHTLLSLDSEPGAPDGIAPCSAGSNGDVMIAGSGVGTDAMTFPEGVAVYAPKGSQMILNLHLFNTTEDEIAGRSGTLVKTVPADAVQQRATTTLAGTLRLNIPPGPVTQTGGCTISKDITLVFVSPHMHQLGVHLRGVVKHGDGTETPLYDDDYDFEEQRIYPIEPVSLSAGDRVEVECTYENTTGETVRFGDSSLSEMCFLTLFHYPELERASFICAS